MIILNYFYQNFFDLMKEVKEGLLEKCINQQLIVIKQFEKEITEAQKQANDYGQPKDRYDAFRTKLMRQIELYAKQLDNAKIVLNTLQMIDIEKRISQVEFGALVITNKQRIFVSAGLGKIEFDSNMYFAISPNVPIYNALKGKNVGDEIVFNGMKIIIEGIY